MCKHGGGSPVLSELEKESRGMGLGLLSEPGFYLQPPPFIRAGKMTAPHMLSVDP